MRLHVVIGRDNNRYAFRDRGDVVRCERCRGIIDKWNAPRHIPVENSDSIGLDVSTTFDGAVVVSPLFRRVVESARLIGLTFDDVGSGYAVLRANRRVPFDAGLRGTRFEDRCVVCGIPDSVVGATPAFLLSPVDIGEDEFVWTDLEFGSGDEKSPLLICGDLAATSLRRAQLTGLEFGEVRTASPARA